MTFRHPTEVERVIAFDLDGVLVETALFERAQNQLMLGLYDQIPTAPTDEDIVVSGAFAARMERRMKKAFMESGGDPIRHYQILLGQTALGDAFPARHRMAIEMAKQFLYTDDQAVGLLETLSNDESTGVALLTSRDRDIVTAELAPGIIRGSSDGPRREGFFDITITADDVGVADDGRKRLKPDTAGLEKIATYYNNIPYERMTMIDDRPSGIIPAAALGVRAIGFASGYMNEYPDALWSSGATAVVGDHQQLRHALLD